MLSRKVIATDITNLTDARYFAARGVDYLLFDMSKTSIEQALEIKEWVEGPELLLLFHIKTLSLVDEAIIRLTPAGISGTEPMVIKEMTHLSAHAELFTWNKDRITIDNLDFETISNSDELLALNKECGIVISGSMEEEVGVKAFDNLDDILDSLEPE